MPVAEMLRADGFLEAESESEYDGEKTMVKRVGWMEWTTSKWLVPDGVGRAV